MAKKEEKKWPKTVDVCPMCGSTNFNVYKDNKVLEIVSNPQYQCNRCKSIFELPLEAKKGSVHEAKITAKMVSATSRREVAPLGAMFRGKGGKILAGICAILMLVSLSTIWFPIFLIIEIILFYLIWGKKTTGKNRLSYKD